MRVSIRGHLVGIEKVVILCIYIHRCTVILRVQYTLNSYKHLQRCFASVPTKRVCFAPATMALYYVR